MYQTQNTPGGTTYRSPAKNSHHVFQLTQELARQETPHQRPSLKHGPGSEPRDGPDQVTHGSDPWGHMGAYIIWAIFMRSM